MMPPPTIAVVIVPSRGCTWAKSTHLDGVATWRAVVLARRGASTEVSASANQRTMGAHRDDGVRNGVQRRCDAATQPCARCSSSADTAVVAAGGAETSIASCAATTRAAEVDAA